MPSFAELIARFNTPGVSSGGTSTEDVEDIVGAMITAAGGSYNDVAGTITLPSVGGASLDEIIAVNAEL